MEPWRGGTDPAWELKAQSMRSHDRCRSRSLARMVQRLITRTLSSHMPWLAKITDLLGRSVKALLALTAWSILSTQCTHCAGLCMVAHGVGLDVSVTIFFAVPESIRGSVPPIPCCELYIGTISTSPTACPLLGYGRASTQNDLQVWAYPSEAVILSTSTPIPTQETCCQCC